jgi:hypothetical protein
VTKRHCASHHPPGLALQPLLRLGLLLQHVVQEQDRAVLDLVDRPIRRLQALPMRFEESSRKEAGDDGVAMSPLSRLCRGPVRAGAAFALFTAAPARRPPASRGR